MSLFRTQFDSGIVAEFLPGPIDAGRVMIICDGLPSMPSKKQVVAYWQKKGYWVFHMRYRGTWESGGEFLRQAPHDDISLLIDVLSNPFQDIWSGTEFRVNPKKIVVMGASFGGTTALMASMDERVDNVVALAPVVDWSVESETEPHEKLYEIIQHGYGGAYRCDKKNFERLKTDDFFNPIAHKNKFDAKKILILHAQDDEIVYHDPSAVFADDIGATFYSLQKGGHLSTRLTTSWWWGRRVQKFLISNF